MGGPTSLSIVFAHVLRIFQGVSLVAFARLTQSQPCPVIYSLPAAPCGNHLSVCLSELYFRVASCPTTNYSILV